MFTNNDFIQVGTCRKPHGVKGLIRAYLKDLDDQALLDRQAFLFIEIDNTFIPYELLSLQWLNDDEALLELQGIEDSDQADILSTRKIYLLHNDAERADVQQTNSDLNGYQIIDKQAGPLGTITHIEDSTENIVAETSSGHTIPLHDDFITDIDDRNKTITTIFPQAIIEYLQQ